jgi:hypothetical protein
MCKVEVVKVEDSESFVGGGTSGSTVKVTLEGYYAGEFVSCDGIMNWDEDEMDLEELFEEWQRLADAGEEGYAYWEVEMA